MSEMYYGYRKLFQYKQYYFQLAMESRCILDECEYCDLFDDEYNDKNSKHFKLALYGRKDDNSNVIRPCCTCCEIMILSDNIMIERDWDISIKYNYYIIDMSSYTHQELLKKK
jgi:hypothetical protein